MLVGAGGEVVSGTGTGTETVPSAEADCCLGPNAEAVDGTGGGTAIGARDDGVAGNDGATTEDDPGAGAVVATGLGTEAGTGDEPISGMLEPGVMV